MTSEPVYRPLIFDLKNPESEAAFRQLLEQNKSIARIDHIELMLGEWIKTQNPGVLFSRELLQERVHEVLHAQDPEQYGVWVFYPWLHRMIHLLPENEFVELRTSRNKYKILPDEQETLRSKKVGVVGLSVGQSVAVTLALERCCGTIRLADFDILELSNMNRIRSGVHEIGELKVVNTAREILEIDPFIQVDIFPEGLHRDNMQAFFHQGGQLDLLVDECDSLDIKLLLREYAKNYRIPVLMDTSDRGMLDIERFDEEPDRPVLHGFVGDLKADQLRDLSTDGKIPHILKIVGVETMSERMKASMIEVEQSIRTWPQLASAVVLGGGVTCDVARRLLLGYGVASGRYFIDLEELVPDERAAKAQAAETAESTEPVFFEYRPFAAFFEDFQKNKPAPSGAALEIKRELLEAMVKDAVQAPSGGNMQSWIWYWSDRQLFLFLDEKRTVKLVDFNALGTLTGLGAAAESLVLAAHARGLHVKVSTFPSADIPEWVAGFEFYEDFRPGCASHEFDDLYEMLYVRQCNRSKFSEPLPAGQLESIKNFAAQNRDFNLFILTEREKINAVGRIAGATDRLRFTNKALHTELVKEIRWTPEEAEREKDGIDLDLIELNPSERAGFNLSRQWPLMRMVADLKGGKGIEKTARELLEKDHAIGLITVPVVTPAAYFEGGRFYQRLWLYCTKLGIDWHPMPALIYSFLRLRQGGGVDMPESMQAEVSDLYRQFEALFPGQPAQGGGLMLMRLVRAKTLPLRSYRRPLEEVLFFDRKD